MIGRTGSLVAAMLLLAGCAAAPVVAGVAGADYAQTTATKKTLIDHVASSVTGEDCSVIAFSETGTYCQEKIVVQRPPIYCFKTLGDVECHNAPDPYRNSDTALASPPPVRVTQRDRGWADADDGLNSPAP
jgi:hypothetical protein